MKADLQEELRNLERLKNELSQVLDNLVGEPTFIELRAMGSILHDFYCGVEKIFKRIAVNVDAEIPKGDDWHIKLLNSKPKIVFRHKSIKNERCNITTETQSYKPLGSVF